MVVCHPFWFELLMSVLQQLFATCSGGGLVPRQKRQDQEQDTEETFLRLSKDTVVRLNITELDTMKPEFGQAHRHRRSMDN